MTRVDVVHVGNEGEPVVVIDGFAPDPGALVDDAGARPMQLLGPFYPGPRGDVGADYLPAVMPGLAPVLREVFGCRTRVAVRRALFSLVTTPAGRLSLPQRIPHVDGLEAGTIAFVHYLFRGDLGGTGFYRHRETGWETIDAARHEVYMASLRAGFERDGEPPPAYIDGDTAVFRRIHRVAPAWNRAVVYRSRLLHCAEVPAAAISGDPRTGRLTVAGFLAAS